MKYRIFSLFYITIVFVTQMAAEDGSHLWLRLPTNARAQVSAPYQSSTLDIAVEELQKAWQGAPVRLVIQKDKQLKPEGFRIRCKDNTVILSAPTEKGLLYAAYHLLRLQQTTNFPLSDSGIGKNCRIPFPTDTRHTPEPMLPSVSTVRY